jgi:hypothetical protein
MVKFLPDKTTAKTENPAAASVVVGCPGPPVEIKLLFKW